MAKISKIIIDFFFDFLNEVIFKSIELILSVFIDEIW